MKGAQAVVNCLKEQGIDTIFGYPGGMILPLYDALYDEKDIRQVLVTHEQNAAHAADGYARATGKVGVCMATSGPGATNLVTGLATAFMDSIPVVAITGQVDTALLGRDAFQEIDIMDMTMPITKHNYKVKDARKLIPSLREAFEIAGKGRPGPVLVDIPRDIFFAEVDYEPQRNEEKRCGKPDPDFLICAAEAAEEIAKAERPVVIVGGGAVSAGASKEITAFIEKYHLPVVHTLMGLGAVPRSHPQNLGFAGMHGQKAANHAIAAADLVIAIGSRFGDRQTGNLSKYTKGTKFIHIDIDPAEIDIMDMTMPITKHNYKVKDARKLIPSLREAFEIAGKGRPGPVLVDIPRDIFFAEVDYEPQRNEEIRRGKPDPDFLICAAEAAEEIAKAERPVVIVGGGAVSAGASKEITAFIEKYHLPVVHTLMGLGAVPRSHPQNLGFAGMHGQKAANHAIAAADLVIAIGSRFGDRQTGNLSKYTKGTKFIHIDIDPAEIDKNVGNSLGLAGDMKVILGLLMRHEAAGDRAEWWAAIGSWEEEYDYDYQVERLTVPWAMHQIAKSTAGKPYAFATDVGQHQMWAALHLRIEEPRTWLTSGGLGTMGFGLPAAMGAQLAYGTSRRVIHVAGDGGIKMTGNEYYTMARLGLPVISLIVNNTSLGMIRQLQKVMYDERYIACEFDYSMDYVAYAGSFGIKAEAVSTQEEFANALQKALADTDHPRVIVLNVWRSFVEPMIKGGARIDEFVEFK